MWPKRLDTPYATRSVERHQMWSSLAAGCHAMPWLPSLRGGFPPEEATTCWEWHNSCLKCWYNGLRYATHDICPTVAKWGTRVLLCHFCPRQKVDLCRQAPLVTCKQDAAHRHTQVGAPGYPATQVAQGLAKGMNSSSSWKKEGPCQSPDTCWNQTVRVRLGVLIPVPCVRMLQAHLWYLAELVKQLVQRGPTLTAVKQEEHSYQIWHAKWEREY